MLFLNEKEREKATAVALGFFDGIHKGHRAVLSLALAAAEKQGLVPAILLFDVHPATLICEKAPPLLMSKAEKIETLEKLGFKVLEVSFGEIMNLSPESFVEGVLLQQLNAKAVCCGYDYRYGKGGKGNAETLKKALLPKGCLVEAAEPVFLDEEIVSSTKIRQLILKGDVEKANLMLGREFSYCTFVEKGAGLGRTLGFPTINQFFEEGFIVPRFGVYASRAVVDGKIYPSVTNIGISPTVENHAMRSETCILDFEGDLYGDKIQISLIKRLRDEKKFPSLEKLKEAVDNDIETARKIYREV